MSEEIDYAQYKTVKAVEEELTKRKDALVRQVKHEEQLRSDKKDMQKSFNEQIKEVKAKIAEGVAVIDGLSAQRKVLEK